MNIDFNLLKNSIGKEFKFITYYSFQDKKLTDKFYAELVQVEDDYIIVKQHLLYMTDDNDNNVGIFHRKLNKGDFTIVTNNNTAISR